jgi:hypothetical protein
LRAGFLLVGGWRWLGRSPIISRCAHPARRPRPQARDDIENIILMNCPLEVREKIPPSVDVCTELLRRGRPRLDAMCLQLSRAFFAQTIRQSAI